MNRNDSVFQNRTEYTYSTHPLILVEHFGDAAFELTTGHYDPLDYSLSSTSCALRRSANSLALSEARSRSRAASPISFSRRSLSPIACSRATRDLVPVVSNAAVSSVEEEVRLKELLARYSDLYLVDRCAISVTYNLLFTYEGFRYSTLFPRVTRK